MSVGRFGNLLGNTSGASLTITNAGSGYNNGTFTLTGTIASCPTAPKIQLVVAGGILQSAYPLMPAGSATGVGEPCTNTPTWTITNATAPGIGTGNGAMAISPNWGTTITDSVLYGELLYDNAGSVAPLNVILNGFEPGLPVTPYGLVAPVQVSG
jgi:hypothetical protein